MVSTTLQAFPPNSTTTPKLVPVFTFNFKVVTPGLEALADKDLPDNSLFYARIINGEIRTVKNEYGLELDVSNITGTDDITDKSSIQINELNCRIDGKTSNGTDVLLNYRGVGKLNEAILNVFTGKSSHSEIEDCHLTCNPIFKVGNSIELKYRWILQENFIGKGRFVRDDEGELYAQYFVYIIR